MIKIKCNDIIEIMNHNELDGDVSQALKNTENSLRDLIAFVLQPIYGDKWIENCGITPQKINDWKERKEIEKKRQKGGTVEDRLIYYANFYELSEIIGKQWDKDFINIFHDKKRTLELLKVLESLRDPEAHNRELLSHQKHLILGISGDIRSQIIKYRSKLETSDSYYPKIESARDSIGNVFSLDQQFSKESKAVFTNMSLRIGDKIDFMITASDPFSEKIEYRYDLGKGECNKAWQGKNSFSINIKEDNIGKIFSIIFDIRSTRSFHAFYNHDDRVIFYYEVLPPKK